MYLIFNDNLTRHYNFEIEIINEHTLKLVGLCQNLSGFKFYNDNGKLLGDYSKFMFDYEEPNLGEKVFKYTDDNHKWVEPIPPQPPIVKHSIYFYANDGGTLEGDMVQIVDDYLDLVIPTPIPNERYEFLEWTPTIPESGKVEKDETYTANFKYTPTLEEIKMDKLKEFSLYANQVIEGGNDLKLSDGTTDHFFYKSYDQANIKNAFDIANAVKQKTGQEMNIPFYDSQNRCKEYTYTDICMIYLSMQQFITYNITLCHQLQAMVKDAKDKETVEELKYNVSSLTGKYLETFNKMIAQAEAVAKALVS